MVFRVQTRIFKALSLILIACLFGACGTSDKARLKESRDAYLLDDFVRSESALYTPEVFKNSQNRLLHYYLLGSIAMSEGQFEKAAYFMVRARETATSARSASGLFEWFSSDYKSNPIEFSYIHHFLVMAYSMLADAGETPAWSMAEIKDGDGNILVQAQTVAARKFSAREIADFRQKARAELRAWDTHLQDLKRTYPNDDYYKEDLWARVLASFIHASSGQNNEKRTAELLMNDADQIFAREFSNYPSKKTNQPQIEGLINRLRKRAQGKEDRSTLFVLEAGVMSKYKIKRFHLGLSTVFSQIKDPGLRSMMEQIGLQMIMNYAPEFGLVVFTGGLAGAIEGGAGNSEDDEGEFDGPPRFFTDAVDRSLGFEIRFPSLQLPPADTQVKLQLLHSKDGRGLPDVALPIVSPIQEILAVELKEREQKEMFSRALRIASQYLAILIPAIKTYRDADREGNGLKKLAVLAGYYISKKMIDRANEPDLRSWSYLPKLIATDVLEVKPGDYDAKISIDNSFGRVEKSLGRISLGDPNHPILYKRIGNLPILNKVDPAAAPLH